MYPQETHLLSSTLNPLSPLHSPHKYPVKQHDVYMNCDYSYQTIKNEWKTS